MSKQNTYGNLKSETINSEDILGKDVLDYKGNNIGVVEKVLIDPINMKVVGISIDKGLFRKGITLGSDYISKITPSALFLKVTVLYEMKGMKVYDRLGKKVGKVSSIEVYGKKNKLKSICVRKNILNIFNKEIQVPSEYIDKVGENIFLKCTLLELEKEQSKISDV